MSEHTPGPLEPHCLERNARNHIGDWYFTSCGPAQVFFPLAGDSRRRNDVAAANAIEIARRWNAYPALLEALEMVRDADNDRIADDGHQYGIPSQARAKIDAAIAKARGGETEQQMISTLKDSIASAAAFKKARGTK